MFDVTQEYRRANKLTDALNTDKLLEQFREEKIEQDSVMDKIAATRSRVLTDAQAAQARREAAGLPTGLEPIDGPEGDVPSPGGSAPPALRDIDE